MLFFYWFLGIFYPGVRQVNDIDLKTDIYGQLNQLIPRISAGSTVFSYA